MRKRFAGFSKVLVSALAVALATTMTPTLQPAQAAEGDSLNVAFGGSLVGTEDYTAQGTELKRGTLQRMDGNEDQVPGEGVVLAGGTEGIRFLPNNFALDSGTKSFLMEVQYTPNAVGHFDTIMSAGGNFYVRAQDGKLRYGWDTNLGGSWTKHTRDVELPSDSERHAISLHYRYTAAQTTVDLMLDGVAMPPVTGPHPLVVASGSANMFGFGNDVHPAGQDRGMPGTLHEVRVAATDGSADVAFEFQPRALTTDLLDVSFDGSLNGTAYVPAAGETVEGALTSRDGATVGGGQATLSAATHALNFLADPNPLSAVNLDAGFVAELEFTPSATQRTLATIFALGGNSFVRYQDGQLRYGFSSNPTGTAGNWSNHIATIALPAAGASHVLSVAYDPQPEGGAKMHLWLDGVAGPTITATTLMRQAIPGGTAFGNDVNTAGLDRGFTGTIQRARLAQLNEAFRSEAFLFQTLDPVATCEGGPFETGNFVAVSAEDCREDIIAKASAVRPTAEQLDWQELQYTGFLHFGPNTFENIEWGYGTYPAEKVNPTNADIDSWLKNLRDAGMKMAVLTVKHHDGFLSYPTRYSDYDISASPWKNGEGDIVKEFTEAAHKYGMGVGLYLSPADSNAEIKGIYANGSSATPRTIPTLVEGDDRSAAVAAGDLPTYNYNATDYGQYFLNQLYEVLTQYGQVDEVWFDGAGGNTSGTERFDYSAYYDLIKKLQPKAQIAVGGRDIRWVGNEHGWARNDEWAVVPVKESEPGGRIGAVQSGNFDQLYGFDDQIVSATQDGRASHLHWWPSEADMKLTPGWFWGPGKDTPKTGQALLDNHWDASVGRNSVLLLNVPPTTEGRLSQSNVDAIMDFAQLRRKAFGNDLALGRAVTVGSETTHDITDGNSRSSWVSDGGDDTTPLLIDLGSPQRVNRISLSEDAADHGQQIREVKVEAKVAGNWQQIATGRAVGVNRIWRLDTPVTAQEFRVTVPSARGTYGIANLSLYQTLEQDPGRPTDIWIDCEAPTAGPGTQTAPLNSLEQLRTLDLAPSATVFFKSGTSCDDSSARLWAYGTADEPVVVTTYDGKVMPTIGAAPAEDWFASYDASQNLEVFVDPDSNREPRITDVGAQSAIVERDVAIQILASDRDGDALTYSATGLPAGVTLNAETGLISGSPTATGTSQVTVTVSDGRGGSASVTFELVVSRAPLVELASEPTGMTLGTTQTISLITNGLPADSVLVVDAPAGWVVSPSRQWVPAGDGIATVTVRAPQSGTSGVITATVLTPTGETGAVSAQIALVNPAAPVAISGVVAWNSAEPAEGGGNGYVTAAVDGNPASFWHTQWQGSNPTHPHFITVDLGSVQTVGSLTYVPRPKSACGSSINPAACNGQIVGFEVHSATGTFGTRTATELQGRSFANPADAVYTQVAKGTFDASNTDAKTVTFDQPVTARYLRLTSTSAVTGTGGQSQPWAQVAELNLRGPVEVADLTDAPLTDARVSVTPTTAEQGSEVTVTGIGFVPGADVTVTLGDSTVTVPANEVGVATARITVPAGQAVGTATVRATDGTAAGTATVTVTPASSPSPSPSASPSASPSPSVSPTPSVSPSPSKSPSVKPSVKPSAKPTTTPTKPSDTFVRTAPYTEPGKHEFNGRQWFTQCEAYSQTERCRTEIWATVVKVKDGQFVRESGWAFNNLTYLPYMTRAAWKGNPLGDLASTTGGLFTSAGRQWKTECDTAATGRGACRSYTMTTVYAATAKPAGGYAFSQSNQWVFNNIVMFGGPEKRG
ncbi:alpha-L-fucosidase [Tessaracoccus sp. ZS01]|uniref:alpha-L-fucosidase n=1 Tax=Tessaracoccus sp. ZS01 TaxID=1906324 RepID=UPI00117E69B6|nr:alpha-L-fucosidase [Tessaracoccus sp. ZS01]